MSNNKQLSTSICYTARTQRSYAVAPASLDFASAWQ